MTLTTFRIQLAVALCASALMGQNGNAPADAVIRSVRAAADASPAPDPSDPFWKDVRGVYATQGPHGNPMPALKTEIRSRWTPQNLYFLFICPYDKLYLKPQPVTGAETNKLWNWDVAEAFLGSDFEHIRQYKEFELSPQGEWVDLDINLVSAKPEGGWLWNSGFQVSARIDSSARVWYGVMKIPFSAVDSRAPKAGLRLRANFYRMQGPPPHRGGIAWQPTHSDTYHVPEAFGTLELAE